MDIGRGIEGLVKGLMWLAGVLAVVVIAMGIGFLVDVTTADVYKTKERVTPEMEITVDETGVPDTTYVYTFND